MLERLNWTLLTVLALVCGAALSYGHFQMVLEPRLVWQIGTASVTPLLARYAGPRMAIFLVGGSQLSFLWLALQPITYVGASLGLPLQDANLARADELLGLDWVAYYRFCAARPILLYVATVLYAGLAMFALAVPAVLALVGDGSRLQRFVLALFVTSCGIALVAIFTPAMGTYFHYDFLDADAVNATGYLVQFEQLPSIRDGSLRVLESSRFGGIITFPSFHAASGVLGMWALWSVRRLRPAVAVIGVGMLLVTPLCGGHYFIDVIVGGTIAALSICLASRLGVNGPLTIAARCACAPTSGA